jgi:uncharacterized protein (DUF433 family)
LSGTVQNGNGNRFALYGGRDPRDIPLYPLDWAAQLLLLPKSTLKAWVFGAEWFEAKSRRVRQFLPLIEPPDRDDLTLSFVNMVEAHVLKAIRRKHYVRMDEVRDGLAILKTASPWTDHPLADIDLLAGGRHFFTKEYGSLLNVGMGKQIAMDFLEVYLSRVERNPQGLANKLFPFTAAPIRVGKQVIVQDTKIVAIDPYVSFGRPIINGTGITTDAIADRFFGGDPIEMLCDEFDLQRTDIESAIRYENAQLAN